MASQVHQDLCILFQKPSCRQVALCVTDDVWKCSDFPKRQLTFGWRHTFFLTSFFRYVQMQLTRHGDFLLNTPGKHVTSIQVYLCPDVRIHVQCGCLRTYAHFFKNTSVHVQVRYGKNHTWQLLSHNHSLIYFVAKRGLTFNRFEINKFIRCSTDTCFIK